MARFFYRADFGGKGPCVVMITSRRWNGYLLRQAGLDGDPFFERPARAVEPDTHPNGHPWAWLYRRPELALADEARVLDAAGLERFAHQLERAVRSANLGETHDLQP